MTPNLSRRDFLKLSGLGFASLLAPPMNFQFNDPQIGQQGRVTTRTIWMYDGPSDKANPVKLCLRDTLLTINSSVIGADETAHNRVWYEIGIPGAIEGFVYSGNIQPVKTIFNAPQTENIPADGLLAEISVPYTDALIKAEKTSKAAYRMYYETTHWIKGAVKDSNGLVWYKVRDDKFNALYYARAEHLRILTADELAPINPDVPIYNKRVHVQLETQLMTAYENDVPVYTASVSTGTEFRNNKYSTPKGAFITYYKRPSRHMANGDLAASGYDLPGVPWVQYLTEGGVSFHGTFWHNDFGRPRSHGCINLSMENAKWLYRWTQPHLKITSEFSYGSKGTRVDITL